MSTPEDLSPELLAEIQAYAMTAEGKRVVTWAGLAREAASMARLTKHAIVRALAPNLQRIDALERRIAELEARPVGLKYRGVWEHAQTYRLHDGVTHHGSVWICRATSVQSEPGRDPNGWQLAVKRGRDARHRS